MMSRNTLATRPTGQRTLGPLSYAMPIMPAILTFGPLLIVIPSQSIFSMIAAVFLGIGLTILWVCMMRVAQQLDQLAPPVEVGGDSPAIAPSDEARQP